MFVCFFSRFAPSTIALLYFKQSVSAMLIALVILFCMRVINVDIKSEVAFY